MTPHIFVRRLVPAAAALAALSGCGGNAGSNRSDSTSSAGSVAQPADTASTAAAPSMVRGTVAAVAPTSLKVSTDSGATVVVALTPPVQVFERGPSSLANVKQNSFIGVTTVKQSDGSERATEIHIFPEALRGLGEGSRMMNQPPAGGGSAASRMTNGSVASSSNGSGGAASRMSNGSVASTSGSTMVVQYAGGSTTVTVPPNVTVTEIKPASKPLAAGDKVIVLTTKNADGSLSSNRVMLAGK